VSAVSQFCPDGYLPMRDAIVTAAQRWFVEEIAAFDRAVEDQAKIDDAGKAGGDSMDRALSQAQPVMQMVAADIYQQTVDKLRNLLHLGKLTAYYFGSLLDQARHAVPANFWATADADGVLEEGRHWPLGQQIRFVRPLFLLVSEFDAQLSDQPARKRPLPEAKIPDLVAALRRFDYLPRKEQRAAVCSTPEFEPYEITERVFREAEKTAGRRPPGRKRKRD